MGAEERREVEELLRTLPDHEEHSPHPEKYWHARRITMFDSAWSRAPVVHRRRTEKRVSEEALGLHAAIDQLKREDVQAALKASVEHLLKSASEWATKLPDALGQASADQKVVALEGRVKSLEDRVAQLEERPEIPIRPLPDEGDPIALLRELREKIGDERFRWFIEDE